MTSNTTMSTAREHNVDMLVGWGGGTPGNEYQASWYTYRSFDGKMDTAGAIPTTYDALVDGYDKVYMLLTFSKPILFEKIEFTTANQPRGSKIKIVGFLNDVETFSFVHNYPNTANTYSEATFPKGAWCDKMRIYGNKPNGIVSNWSWDCWEVDFVGKVWRSPTSQSS